MPNDPFDKIFLDRLLNSEAFYDGTYISYREFSNNTYQVHTKDLYHICECTTRQAAKLIAEALDREVKIIKAMEPYKNCINPVYS